MRHVNSGIVYETVDAMQTAALMSLALEKQRKSSVDQDCIVYCLVAIGIKETGNFASVSTVRKLHGGHVRFMVSSCDRFVCQFVYFVYAASNIDSM